MGLVDLQSGQSKSGQHQEPWQNSTQEVPQLVLQPAGPVPPSVFTPSIGSNTNPQGMSLNPGAGSA
eukprot:3468589-Amphidinium_carterae.1